MKHTLLIVAVLASAFLMGSSYRHEPVTPLDSLAVQTTPPLDPVIVENHNEVALSGKKVEVYTSRDSLKQAVREWMKKTASE